MLCRFGKGLEAYLKIKSGILSIGRNRFVLIKGFPDAVKINGAVSPAILEIDSKIPEIILLKPVGKITFNIVL
jgi:hypothetical protein